MRPSPRKAPRPNDDDGGHPVDSWPDHAPRPCRRRRPATAVVSTALLISFHTLLGSALVVESFQPLLSRRIITSSSSSSTTTATTTTTTCRPVISRVVRDLYPPSRQYLSFTRLLSSSALTEGVNNNDEPRRPVQDNLTTQELLHASNNYKNRNSDGPTRKPRKKQFHKNNKYFKKSDWKKSGTKVPFNVAFNKKIVACHDAVEVLDLLQRTPGVLTRSAAAENKLSSINFSTAIHRIARHCHNTQATGAAGHHQQQQQRKQICSDPRFALFLVALAEDIMTNASVYQSREFSNIGWALVKLKIVPPQSALPLLNSASVDENTRAVLDCARDLRQQILNAVQARRAQGGGSLSAASWIPTLSRLTGRILDYVGSRAVTLGGFHRQEIANLLWAWATANRADRDVFGHLVLLLVTLDKKESNRPQEWSNSIWAMAKAQVYLHHEELMVEIARLLQDKEFLEAFKPQELSNTLWGFATLLSNIDTEISEQASQAALQTQRLISTQLIARGTTYRTQELSNSLWAFATLGFGLSPSAEQAANQYVILPSEDLERDREIRMEAVDAIVHAFSLILGRARSQELNNVAWSLARLVDVRTPEIDALLSGIGYELSNPSRRVSSQDIGTTIWSLASLGYSDTDTYHGLAARWRDVSGAKAKPQEFSNSVWGIATAEIEVNDRDCFDTTLIPDTVRPKPSDSITVLFGIAADQLMRRPYDFKPQEVKDILWGLSKVGIRHPSLYRSVAEHIVGSDFEQGRGLHDFSPQALANMVWAFARQAQLVEDVSTRWKGTVAAVSRSGRLAVYSTSNADIGEGLLQSFFAMIAETALTSFEELSQMKPQDLSNSAWTFGVLGFHHEAYGNALVKQLHTRLAAFLRGQRNSMTYFKGQEIGNLLWALATINFPVGDVLDEVSRYMEALLTNGQEEICITDIARYFKRQELANLGWACAVFGYYPEKLMRIIYRGLVGFGDEQDPSYIARVFGDDGLQHQEVTTLIYLHLAMRQETRIEGLYLPPDFPGAWYSNFPKSASSFETNFELSLSTSRIQREVANAFHRTGFPLVEEHVITMEEMADEHGVDFPRVPLEVLSIDIANVERKIAIEVDGPAHFVSRVDLEIDAKGYVRETRGKFEYKFGWDGTKQKQNGPTVLKERLLRSFGWTVVNVPFWEWYALGSDEEAQEQYCRELLHGSM